MVQKDWRYPNKTCSCKRPHLNFLYPGECYYCKLPIPDVIMKKIRNGLVLIKK